MSFDYRFELPTTTELEDMGQSECPFNHACMNCEYDCELEEETMNEYVRKSILLNEAIENEFAPLDWADITVHEDEGTGSISFTGPRIRTEDGETCTSAGFRGREDGFFAKMRRVTAMIQNCGYTASMVRFEADKLCPYSEVTIEINFEGGEL